MYLKSLELQGFKSFADKTVLTFGSDITAIVGPNGSGKSNISDAIRWVMGEQSTKALRGAKMEDVIFGGTQKRAQVGFAEASLLLDNSDGAFRTEDKEIMVTRRYYRSGESEYYINRKSARLRDVHELFMDTGLGKEGYSNISQGRIDEILSLKSTDRREIFEEAAGISKFRHRKEETERKLAHTDDNLLRIGDKIAELEMQVEPLREQAAKARKYLELRDELKGVEIAVWLDALEKLSAAKKKAEEDYISATFILAQEHEALDRLYERADQLSADLRSFDEKMEAKRTEISLSDGSLQRLEGEKNVLQAAIDNNTANISRVRAELDEQESRGSSLQEQIEKSEQRIAGIAAQTEALNAKLMELEKQAARVTESGEGIAREYLSLQSSLSDARSRLAQRETEAVSAHSVSQEARERSATVLTELQEAKAKLQELQNGYRDAKRELRTAQEDVTAAQNTIAGYELRLGSRENRQNDLQQQVNALRIQRDTLSSRIRLLEEMERDFEGYNKAVRVVMQEAERGSLKNIHGPVSKLIRTDEEYAVAIETALGAAMQHIVVTAESDGKAGINLLKRRDGGRATFLPISVITGKALQEKGLDLMPGFIGLGSDLVDCDDRYRSIVLNLLGRTVIAEDLDYALPMAKKFQNRFRIVTLDGQVINAGGSMTGGSVSRNAGILSRANELLKLRKQHEKQGGKLEELERQLQEATRSAEEVRYELGVESAKLREAEDLALRREGDVRHYTQMIETVEEVIRSDEREAASVGERLQEAERTAVEKETQAAMLREQIIGLEDKLNRLELGRSEASEQVRALTAAMEEKKLERASCEAEGESLRGNIVQLRQLAAQMQGDSRQKEALIGVYEEENRRTVSEIAALDAQCAEAAAAAARLREELAALTQERMTAEAEKTVSERSAQDKNRDILKMQGEAARLEQKKVSSELEEKQIIDKLWDSYQLTPSTAGTQKAELESVAQGQRRITELKRKISSLGTPNLGAIEEFDRVNERYEYLSGQRDDVLTSKKDLEDIIRTITREMTAIFTTEFKKINEYFGATFTEMFGGGKASLELEDPEDPLGCGIEIRVQPPGKQLKTITLLSGGEKAFVAIALYFAILKVRPTPFCMLDEIDAALDDRNVERFASYLRSLSKMTQFIVVTHRRGTMEEADTLYGVTMQEQGVSKMLHLDMNQMVEQLGITE
ncbi:MAG: chromosome segregation protein SMC [Oscillospiraceae bacterium]|nr:chromosome segregation protein SMC [Oscillospiraceae bacterium]